MKTSPQPVAHPRQPALALPPGSCDAHCHVFGPFDRFVLPDDRSFTPPLAPQTVLRAWHERFGIDRCVLVQSQGHAFDHSAMIDALRTGNGRYKGVALVRDSDSDATLQAWTDAGVCAARFNFLAHLGGKPDLDAIRRTVARVAPLGWHVAVHVAGNDIVEYAPFLRELGVQVVIDHMARPAIGTTVDDPVTKTLCELLDTGRFWVKLSAIERMSATGMPFDDALPFAQHLAVHAPERVLWGSDWPHVNLSGPMPDDGDLVDTIARIVPDAKRRQLLLVDNPAKCFGFA